MADDGATRSDIRIARQSRLGNIPGRKFTSLNGKWNAIIDPYDFGIGSWAAIWKDQKPKGKTDFYEYSFEGGVVFDVPGDFNSQLPELTFFEGTVWYKKTFDYKKNSDKRAYIHFDGVNYAADIFLNSEKIGSHEGGFTPFQFELTDKVKEGNNSIIIRVNNQRIKDGIPALGFDWFNYGGITRDVSLVETPESYIEDYFIQLAKGSEKQIEGWVKLNGSKPGQNVRIQIPEAKIDLKAKTNAEGYVKVNIPAKLTLWSPEYPKLYNVLISSETDKIEEEIGFRNIAVKGTDIFLNGKSIFLKGVSFHEEIPQDKRRAYSESDAKTLLTWAKELGCNFIRLAHYPQNDHIVRMAEKMGLMMWEEIPVYQGIAFGDAKMQSKMDAMLSEMVNRDKNRCGIIIWSMSNETSPGKARNTSIINMAKFTKSIDPTRLIASAFNKIDYNGNTITISDTLSRHLDVISVNQYLGWYNKWPSKPEEVVWKSEFNKPLIMSEFGAEALYGNHGASDIASSWTEEYQEQLYKDQLTMLKNIPFLRGSCPWILVDFRSPRRLHPTLQDGQNGMWNRKGLLSDKGYKKKAWFVMHNYYKNIK
ncbi:MAG: beta galactosidase jelly roll domain-containing protein [Sphingobacteriaceae bacterium]|nr:beta galactosidase jelly roll domain-containing protein [Sphingobacteriaceae bacterium]